MTGNLDIAYMGQTLPRLLDALPITLLLFFTAALLLVLFAIGLTFVRIFETPVLFPLSAVMTSFIRGTPLLLQLLVIYYGLPLLLRPLGIDINGIGQFAYAALALVLHDGTYLSELLLPAYRAIGRDQHDAADSLGFTAWQKFRHVILPQMVPIVLPGWGNVMSDMLKDTSVLFTIGMVDLMGRGKQLIAGSYGIGKVEIYLLIAAIYWLCAAGIDEFTAWLEARQPANRLGAGIGWPRRGSGKGGKDYV